MYDSEEDDEFFVMLDQEGRVYGYSEGFDFSTRSWNDFLDLSDPQTTASLLSDLRVVDSPMAKATFWLGVGSMAAPRCAAERLAASVFALHTRGVEVDPETSGAEWWVQHRKGDAAQGGAGIHFHWDKDEEARHKTGIFVHPQVATVTYLTARGAPTVILDHRAEAGGGGSEAAAHDTLELSYPAAGKHLCFDGRLLHGCPARAARAGGGEGGGDRVTFLVNIWVGHRPAAIQPLPDALLKLTTCPPARDFVRPGSEGRRPLEVDLAGEEDPAAEWVGIEEQFGGASGVDHVLRFSAPLAVLGGGVGAGGGENTVLKLKFPPGGAAEVSAVQGRP